MPGGALPEWSAPEPFQFPGLLHTLERRFNSRRLKLLLYHPKSSRGEMESYSAFAEKCRERLSDRELMGGGGAGVQLEDITDGWGPGWVRTARHSLGEPEFFFHLFIISCIPLSHVWGLSSARTSLCCYLGTHIDDKHVYSPVLGTLHELTHYTPWSGWVFYYLHFIDGKAERG